MANLVRQQFQVLVRLGNCFHFALGEGSGNSFRCAFGCPVGKEAVLNFLESDARGLSNADQILELEIAGHSASVK